MRRLLSSIYIEIAIIILLFWNF